MYMQTARQPLKAHPRSRAEACMLHLDLLCMVMRFSLQILHQPKAVSGLAQDQDRDLLPCRGSSEVLLYRNWGRCLRTSLARL